MSASLLAFILAHALDAHTTCVAMHYRQAQEANALLPSTCPRIVLVKAATTTAGAAGLYELHKHHPKLATWITLGGTAVAGAVVVHNLKEIR